MPVNGERKQRHERPAIVKSNLKSILVFVKHTPDQLQTNKQFYYIRWPTICRFRVGMQSCLWGVTIV